jgi:DNA polymerase III alpha subunit
MVQPIAKLPPDAIAPPGAYFASAAEMKMRFAHFPKAIRATQEIAKRCKFDLPLGVPHMPTIALPPGKTASQVLRERRNRGQKTARANHPRNPIPSRP